MPFLHDPHPPVTVPVERRGDYPVRRIFCIGRNYAEHAAEMGNDVDRSAPFFFTKTPAHVALSGGAWRYPPGTADLHHEVELVLALGDGGAIVAGGVGLDMTRRDLQATAKEKRHPWDAAKDFEGSAILAPLRERANFDDLDISLTVNDAVRQAGNTRDMIHPIPALLSHLGGLYTLGPGDLVMTGTPAGVGSLVPGDRLAGRIDGLPELTVEITR